MAVRRLFHTTSLPNLLSILREKQLRAPYDGFVSFSEIPFRGDISHNDVVMVFDRSIARALLKVEYTEAWYDAYPEHAAYIAGEGWREMYQPPPELYEPPEDLDEDEIDFWEPDEEAEEAAYREAELSSFLYKDSEREWVSRDGDVSFKPDWVERVLVLNKRHVGAVRKALQKEGFGHVTVGAVRNRRTASVVNVAWRWIKRT